MDQPKHFEDFLSDPNFDQNYEELVLHAHDYARQRTWCGLFGSIDGEAKFSATDIVDGLILKIMKATPEKRSRHFNDRFAIMAQLKGMIKSEIHGLIRKKVNAPAPIAIAANDDGDVVEIDPIAEIPAPENSPALLVAEREEKQQLLLELIDYVKDPLLVQILSGLIDGKTRPQMAAEAGITIDQFDNARQRLGRKAREFAASKQKVRKS